MARTSPASPRRRFGAGLGGLVLATTLAGCSVPFVGGHAPSGVGSTGGAGEQTVVCESGIVHHAGGVDTSSAVVLRVPAGTPVPPGCRAG